MSASDEGKIYVVTKKLFFDDTRGKIPTSFVSLGPDRLVIEENIDVLVGLFHIMWEDMPRKRTYRIRLAESVSREGTYVGCFLWTGNYGSNNLDLAGEFDVM